MFETIDLDIRDGIARLTLNRPEAANSMNPALVRDLARAALVCDTDASVKVVLITGRGKMFCAGGDLKAFAAFGDQTPTRVKEVADELHKAVSLLARMSAVVVIAVNGMAAGAGFSLCLTGDYVLAAESAKFTMAYTRAGLSPDGSSTYFMPRLIGMRRAQELMLTNRMLSAAEALDWGLITKVVPDVSLDEAATAVATQLAAGSGAAHATVKRLLLGTHARGLEEQMEIEGREIARRAADVDGIEGIQAFLGKRPPRFT